MVSSIFAQVPDIQLLQINSTWNLKNDLNSRHLPTRYKAYSIRVEHATLENQSPVFQEGFKGKPLPILILRVNGKLKYQWTADLSFKLKLTRADIIKVLDKVFK
tara:strand:+ start:1055 stop:1366 length:312 start_codon:yes stop_codon:yes gene_type:complete